MKIAKGSKPISISVDKATMELIELSGKSPTVFFRELTHKSPSSTSPVLEEFGDGSSIINSNLDVDLSKALVEKRCNNNWLIEGLDKGSIGFLTGEGSIGKTKFALNLAIQLSSGLDLSGLNQRKCGKSVYVTCEDSQDRITDTLIDVIDAYGIEENKPEIISNLSLVDFSKTDSDFLNGPMQDYLLENHVESDLFIFDTFSDLHSLDENSSRDMNRLMKALTRFAARTNSSVLILHHTNKASLNLTTQQMRSQSFVRGSSVIVNKAKFFIRLTDIQKGEVELKPGENLSDYVHVTIGGNSIKSTEFMYKRGLNGVLMRLVNKGSFDYNHTNNDHKSKKIEIKKANKNYDLINQDNNFPF